MYSEKVNALVNKGRTQSGSGGRPELLQGIREFSVRWASSAMHSECRTESDGRNWNRGGRKAHRGHSILDGDGGMRGHRDDQ